MPRTRDNSDNYDMLYMPEVNPRNANHKCQKPTMGELGSIVGCKECGTLYYFQYKPDKWHSPESSQFIKVRWYHFGLKRKLRKGGK